MQTDSQDPFYQKIDVAAPLRYKARQGFVREVCAGEHAMRVGRAALFIAAEDDAAVSNSAVPLPVEPYLARLDRMASDAAALLRSAKSDGPEAAVGVVSRYLFETMRFNVPFDGASALPNAR